MLQRNDQITDHRCTFGHPAPSSERRDNDDSSVLAGIRSPLRNECKAALAVGSFSLACMCAFTAASSFLIICSRWRWGNRFVWCVKRLMLELNSFSSHLCQRFSDPYCSFISQNDGLDSLQATNKLMMELMKCDLGFYHHRVSLIAVVRGMVTRWWATNPSCFSCVRNVSDRFLNLEQPWNLTLICWCLVCRLFFVKAPFYLRVPQLCKCLLPNVRI